MGRYKVAATSSTGAPGAHLKIIAHKGKAMGLPTILVALKAYLGATGSVNAGLSKIIADNKSGAREADIYFMLIDVKQK